jgi:hypothetical protein
MNIQNEFFEINEFDNLIDNLEMAVHFIEVPLPYKWKWVIIAMHQALYGALITTLQSTDHRQTVIDRTGNKGQAITLHIDGVPIPAIAAQLKKSEDQIVEWITNPYLISLDEALRRVKEQKYLPSFDNAMALVTTKEEDEAIKRLTDEFRNKFEHFTPTGWIIYTSIMPPIVRHSIRVISFLQFESNCVHHSEEREKRIKAALARIDKLLSQIAH